MALSDRHWKLPARQEACGLAGKRGQIRLGKSCHETIGLGKVERASRLADELGFDLSKATFYSDSYTDLPLLEKVDEPVVVNPDPRLKRLATKRGWPIQIW